MRRGNAQPIKARSEIPDNTVGKLRRKFPALLEAEGQQAKKNL